MSWLLIIRNPLDVYTVTNPFKIVQIHKIGMKRKN